MQKPNNALNQRLDRKCEENLLFHLPFRYQDRSRIIPLRAVKPGEHVVIEGEIATVVLPKGGRTRFLCQLTDGSGQVHLRFFYMNAIQLKTLRPGVRLRCFGEVRLGNSGLEMIHPEYHIISEGMDVPVEKTLTPIYPTTEGLSQLFWKKVTDQALQLLMKVGIFQEANDIQVQCPLIFLLNLMFLWKDPTSVFDILLIYYVFRYERLKMQIHYIFHLLSILIFFLSPLISTERYFLLIEQDRFLRSLTA